MSYSWYYSRWCGACDREVKRPLTGEKGKHVQLWNEGRCYYCGHYFRTHNSDDSSEKCPKTGRPHEWRQKMQVSFNYEGDIVGSEPSGRYFCAYCLKEVKDPYA